MGKPDHGPKSAREGRPGRWFSELGGFLGRRVGDPVHHLSIILLRAGDVELNPGPTCAGCQRALARGLNPLVCLECGDRYHLKCSGLTKHMGVKKRGEDSWKCRRCEGSVEQEERVQVRLAEDGEEEKREEKEVEKPGEEKCGRCKRRLREAKVIPRCRECRRRFHVTCAEVTRAELEGEVSEGRWRCGGCSEEVGMRRRSQDDASAEVSGGEGKAKEWEKGEEEVLRVLQWNADGIWNKKAELEELLGRLKVGVALVQESKLGERSKTPVFEGYSVVRKDRTVIRRGEEMTGGGLLTLVRKDIPFRRLHGWKGTTTEGLSVAVDVSRKERLILTNVYRPPIRRVEGEDERVEDEVRVWLRRKRKELVAGDLNLHSRRWGATLEQERRCARQVEELEDWMEENDYAVLNDGSGTCVDRRTGRESVPDVTIVEGSLRRRCKWRATNELGSDHRPIVVEIDCKREQRKKEVRVNWAWKKVDWEKYREELEGASWSGEGLSMREKVEELTSKMIAAAKKSIPTKKVKTSDRPFWDEELEQCRVEREELRRSVGTDVLAWREKNEEMKRKLEEKKREYWKKFLDEVREGTDEKEIWRTVKSLKTGRSADGGNEILVVNGKEARTDRQKANRFINSYAGVGQLKGGKIERRGRV